jgi:hypothetical protein
VAVSSPAGLVNGDFQISDPSNPNFGWTVRGSGTVDGDHLTLREDSRVITTISRPFVVPQNPTTLVFTITNSAFQDNGPNDPPDAFEVALLDHQTMLPLAGTAAGLTNTDALLNLQPTGQVFVSPQVTVSGVSASGQIANLGQAMTVTVDLHGLSPGTQGTLEFDLLGFGPTTSTVSLVMGTPAGSTVGGGGSAGSGGGSQSGGGGGSSGGGGSAGSSGGSQGGGSSSGGGTGSGQPGGSGNPGTGTNSGTIGGTTSGEVATAVTVAATEETAGGSAGGGGRNAGFATSLAAGSEGSATAPGAAPVGFVVSTESGSFGSATSPPTLRPELLAGSGGGSTLQGDDATDAFWNWLGEPGRRGPGAGGRETRPREGPNRPVGNEISDEYDDFWPWLRQKGPGAGAPAPQPEPVPDSPPQACRSVDAAFAMGQGRVSAPLTAPAAGGRGATATVAPSINLGWIGVLALLQCRGTLQERQSTRKRPRRLA